MRPSRALGQNFVVDPNTLRKVVDLAEVEVGDRVVEVGAGAGSLTLALADAGASVVTIERDRHLLPVLEEVLGDRSDVRVVEADALTVGWDQVIPSPEDPAEPWKLVANLPYNVATPVVLRVLDEAPAIRSVVVMVQAEVGERLAAGPGHAAYGSPSVKVAYHATARIVARIGSDVFWPRPRVSSVLVRIDRLARPAVEGDPGPMFALVRRAFGQRRKMLRRSLAEVVDRSAFAEAGVRPEARPEELGVEDWGRLAAAAASAPPLR